VVIPVRNGESTLADQLRALFRQEAAPPFEVIVADNGSTDRSCELVERLALESPPNVHLSVLSCPDRVGVSAARNAGAAASAADLVLICDADDVVSPCWVQQMAAALEQFDVVGGALNEVTLNPVLDTEHRRGLDTNLPISLGFLPYATGANVGVRRDVIKAIGGWNETFIGGGDDVDFSWRAQLAGFTLGFSESAVIDYRLRLDLKGAYTQAYRYARSAPKLYREYRHAGARRRGARSIVHSWYWIISRAFLLPFGDYGFRRKWCRRSGLALGRIAGSVSSKVIYL
jgi:glycosyltransferase involved in cell wall biosynthesis